MKSAKLLSISEVLEYVQGIPGLFSPQAKLVGNEIGDGNMNFVFRVADQQADGQSVIVKQTLPYMRSVGETWPLTVDRIRIEYETLLAQHKICPDLVPSVYHFDADLSVIVMEDLASHTILRTQLVSQIRYPQFGLQIGIFLARTLFLTSHFALNEAEMRSNRQRFKNTDMVQITSDFVFTFPFMDHEMNRYNPVIHRTVHCLWNNQKLQDEVASLKQKFNSDEQALLHGDLHTGSIMVTENNTKVIDPEFAFYGPIGFDIGTLVANLLLSYCSYQVDNPSDGNTIGYQMFLLKTIEMIWQHFETEFRALWMDHCGPNASDLDNVLVELLGDSFGFAGCEMIRRVTGTSHVLDLERIEHERERAVGETFALQLGQRLILERNDLRTIHDLTEVAQQTGETFQCDR